MSTNSNIAVVLPSGEIRNVYCHYDGNIECVGSMLLNFYDTQELAELVTSLGDISYLCEKYESEPGHSFATPIKGITVVYGRDRGDADCGPEVFKDLKAYLRSPKSYFNYLFKDDQWYVYFGNKKEGELLVSQRILY